MESKKKSSMLFPMRLGSTLVTAATPPLVHHDHTSNNGAIANGDVRK
jgi:hypothetical protein